ncbi:MAG: NAD(P)/FAD-dependent oxidoreductase, partial [Ureaplasma sp.]|nr:NAD(P)/FAD-dependent oxidoreductase [Ureaplasma sp.]
MDSKIYDLIVIGAGPVGLYATFWAKYLKLDVLCIEKDEFVGGQVTKLYPSKMIHDFPTHKNIQAKKVIDLLEDQVGKELIKNKINIIQYEKIDDETIKLIGENGEKYYTKNILFTIGPGSFEFIKIDESQLIDVEEDLIDYTFKLHKLTHKNLKTIIFGGGDSALDYAYELKMRYEMDSVTLVHRGEKMRGISHTIEELDNIGVKILLNTQIKNINKNNCCLIQNENEISLQYDLILVQFGVKSIWSEVHNWIEFEKKNNRFVVDRYQKTNIENFYASGNCCYNDFKIDAIMSGISEATIAINHIHYKIKKNNKPTY